MLAPVSNPEKFCSTSPSFWLRVCKHEVFCSICFQKALNTHVEMIEHKQSAQKPMPLHKRTPQGQARRLQERTSFSDALRNNTARIHLLFLLQKALQTPHSQNATQKPTAAWNKSVQSRVHNRNLYINSPSHNSCYGVDCSIVGTQPTGWKRLTQEAQMRSGSNKKIT